MAPRGNQKDDRPVKKVTEDKRFSHVQDDPRFIRPKKSHTKVKVDKRFAHMIEDADFTETTKVDRYGRVQEDNRAKAYLENTYNFSGSESEGEESDSEESAASGSEKSEDESELSGEDVEVDRARGLGMDSDESSDSEDDSDVSDVEWGKFGGGRQGGGLSDVEEDPEDIPRGDETRRFASVNMDWDHVRATDLFAVFSGFKPDSGAVLSVKVYPSDFGAERMAKEAVEGPPREIFNGTKADSDNSDDEVDLIKEQVKDDSELDQIALRKYELEKMRYYFAVVECDSINTAKAIYSQCDGAEYEASANFFDLRFIPDGVTFDRKPKDEAIQMPEKYVPAEFSTQALQHSKVQLTWDADEPERVKTTRRAFTQEEIDNMDFGNLLASSSDDEESDDEANLVQKRALLLAKHDSDDESDRVGDMEITFTPGLSKSAKQSIDSDDDNAKSQGDETTIERFRRLKKEKREKWKASKKDAKQSGHDSDNLVSDNELDPSVAGDSFFTYGDDQMPSKPLKSTGKNKKGPRETKAERMQRHETETKERAELELLLDGAESGRKHFDLKEIVKAEKSQGRKGKRGKKIEVEDDFKLNVSDPRFGALFESHNFAIDPNNPNFKKTKAMKDLLSETRKRHKTSHN
ncbi:pre-rRNA-processing protein esf1 [Coemansia sp. RSA 2526]|nr:pre-rRNA-processing protein esf1 [Coemansia sp. RSA 1752]KAJ2258655.1 pre-rRNA-processing protein esf1 [Coemansia sp. RSA 454]KAJ2405774.1 pre-rRNA-processing protein esf1 [Coemansia sp. RSA 2526]